MNSNPDLARCTSLQELLDTLLNYKLNTETVSNCEAAITEICTTVDSLKDKESGYRLLSITNDKNSLLHLVLKRAGTSWPRYKTYTWTIDEKIEKGISAKIHDSGDDDLASWMDGVIVATKGKTDKFPYDSDDLIEYLVAESFSGYVISKKKFQDQCTFLESAGKVTPRNRTTASEGSLLKELEAISDWVLTKTNEKRNEVRSTIIDFAENLDCEKLSLNISHSCIAANRGIGVGKITKVIQNNNTRTYKLIVMNFIPGNTEALELTLIPSVTAGVPGNSLSISSLGNIWISETRPSTYSEIYALDNFGRLPYNFIDEGRILVGIPRINGSYDIIIGGDPRTDKEATAKLLDILDKYIDTLVRGLTKLYGTKIIDVNNTILYEGFETSVTKEFAGTKPLQLKLKALKKMVEEFQYIVKKQASVGSNVEISDKITYNHSNGRISYTDFSIAVSDELLKSRLHQTFETYLVSYYRNETTEEEILTSILDKIFEELKSRINSYSQENTLIKIVLNDKINIDLEIRTSKTKSRLLYLNGQRFNRNEVLTVLREITCYRSQEEVDRFISNIGKLGLSVYIGITSGYEATIDGSKRLFRFKKQKGRSNYAMQLDSIEIPIKGKELINALFAKFVGENIPDFNRKVQKTIFESVASSLDYAKYKFLIDSTYESFKTRSQAFLNKKVDDVNGEHCKYYNAKGRRTMLAVTLLGMSGHRYIIAYDNKDSYVFIDPELKPDEKGVYQNGKYICMIDQSNIKSNIGYDTVISKLLALKNDSVIAGTIYNLEEELSE